MIRLIFFLEKLFGVVLEKCCFNGVIKIMMFKIYIFEYQRIEINNLKKGVKKNKNFI